MRKFAILLAALSATLPLPSVAQTSGRRCDDCVVLLGTRGGPVVDPSRSEPANLLVVNGTPYLIDAGAGVARQIVAAGFPLASVHTIFITHHHLDHTAGLEPLISLDWIGKALANRDLSPVNVYGPPATQFLVSAALNYLSVSEAIFRAGMPNLAQSRAMFIGHDELPGVIYKDANIKVTAVSNTHFSHPSRAPGGQENLSFSYRFETPKGVVVFTGDTGPSPAVDALAKGADILVSEVYLPRDTGSERAGTPVGRELADHMAQEHLNPVEVGKMASAAGVKRLVLTHLAMPDTADAQAKLLAGIRMHYAGPVVMGTDLASINFGVKP